MKTPSSAGSCKSFYYPRIPQSAFLQLALNCVISRRFVIIIILSHGWEIIQSIIEETEWKQFSDKE